MSRRPVPSWCAAALAIAAIVLGPAAAAAEPKPTAAELRRELAELEKRADRLIRTYNGKRVALQRAQDEERAARERLRAAEEAYRTAARQVGDLANLRYQSGGLELPNGMFGQDLGQAAVLEYLAAQRAAELGRYARTRDERRAAAEQAARLTERIRRQAAEVNAERRRAERLIAQIKQRLDRLVPLAPGRLPGGGFAPELPGGPDNITPRTRLMRDLVNERFPTGFPTGCFRAGNDGGEHPLGRACDFMLSSGGAMPSPDKVALGHRIAEFVIENGRKLGVKYVIYRQRIYHMSNPGWRPMADRGSVTANHFDHVHVSML
ncbi:MAG: hypothetical protein DIU60_019835 [Actinomycetes bacterium]